MTVPSTILFLLTCMVARVAAQEPDDISKEIDKMLGGSPVPSLAAAAVLDGKIIALGAAGIRKVGDKTKVTIDDKYHIGSCTKSMTATVAAMLVASGKLDWETTVSDAFHDVDIHRTYRKVTLRQLLTNTGGAPGDVEAKLWESLWTAEGDPTAQRMQLVRGILEKPAAYEPGTRQMYSNAGFAIAGAMLEAVTKEPYEELITRMLFKPLSMDSAGFRAPATNGKTDQPYGHTGNPGEVVPVPPEPAGDNPTAIAPAGAIHCSVSDFAKYAAFHLGGRIRENTFRTDSEDPAHSGGGHGLRHGMDGGGKGMGRRQGVHAYGHQYHVPCGGLACSGKELRSRGHVQLRGGRGLSKVR